MIVLMVVSFIASVCADSVTNVEEESRSMLKLLIEKGVDINATDSRGYTALLHSIKRASHNAKYQEYPLLLIENGANVQTTTEEGYNALHFATRQLFSVRLIELLLEKGVDVNAQDYHTQSTPLKNAIKNIEGQYKNNTLPVVKMLLEKGANASVRNKEGETLLQYSWNRESYEIAALLFIHGAHLRDEKSRDIFVKLLGKKEVAIPLMKSLIEKGFDVNTKFERTILEYSILASNCELAIFLINNGAEIERYLNEYFRIAARMENCLSLMKLLLEKGADVNSKSEYGWTAFHASLSNDRYENAKFLLANGADATAKTVFGTTALICLTNKTP